MKEGINLANIDKDINPKDDFYGYACGGWMKEHPLPPEFPSFGTFDVLREKAREQLQSLILELGEDPLAKTEGTINQKVYDIYSLGMDEERLNREKDNPIKPLLAKIEVFSKDKLIDYIAWLHEGIDSPFFSSGVGAHPQNSNLNILHIGETGLGMGDRDYYLEDTEENLKIRKGYEVYIKKLMSLIGKSEEEQERIWKNLIEIETKIAQHKMTREERRDPLLHLNMFSIEDLKKEFKNIDWDKYFKLLEISPAEANVSSLKFLKFMDSYLPTLSEEAIKDYLTVGVVGEASSLLSDDFIDTEFEFYGKLMSGQKEKKPRWKRAMGLATSMFGEAVGKIYVEKYFPEENKKYMLGLVENLRNALKQHIMNLTWMSDETKGKALDKLNSMTVKIGYPDKWKDYKELRVDKNLSYQDNVLNASKWFTKDNYSKLGKPVDKEEWHMTPQTVNAYYSPVVNEICFPAAILQPPYFNIEADDALNYGAIGVVIGHEMTHGFDDQGRQYDKEGNLADWWAKEDAERFQELAQKLVEQFNKVEVAPGVNANGQFTLGENIADQGGLRVALTAYENTVGEKPVIDGLSPLQRFYLSYAQVWADNITPELILQRTKSDPHSLGMNRVNVTLKNLQPFFEAFEIKEGDKMFRQPEERVIIW